MIEFKDGKLIDIVPKSLASIPEVQALSFVMEILTAVLMERLGKIGLFYDLENVDESVLDFLAIDLGTQYYEQSLPIEVKRNLIKNTMSWYSKAGTVGAIEELVKSVFTDGEVIEWFNYKKEEDRDPYYFLVRTDFYTEEDSIAYFTKLLKYVKNARSWLSAIQFLLTDILHNKEDFIFKLNMTMPVYEVASDITLNKIWLRLRSINQERLKSPIPTFNGEYYFNGAILFNAEPYDTRVNNRIPIRNKETFNVTINGEPA